MKCSSVWFAHSPDPSGRCHALREHLSSVSRLAANFARGLSWADEARLSGLIHAPSPAGVAPRVGAWIETFAGHPAQKNSGDATSQFIPALFPDSPSPDIFDQEADALVVRRVEPEHPGKNLLGLVKAFQPPEA